MIITSILLSAWQRSVSRKYSFPSWVSCCKIPQWHFSVLILLLIFSQNQLLILLIFSNCFSILYSSLLLSFSLFINYILLIVLLQLSWFLPLCPPAPRTPHSLRQSPYPCLCPWVMGISSPFPLLYLTFPWLFWNYLFVLLNPFTSHPFSHTHPESLYL